MLNICSMNRIEIIFLPSVTLLFSDLVPFTSVMSLLEDAGHDGQTGTFSIYEHGCRVHQSAV